MYFKIKLNRNISINNKEKRVIETYFTDALHFADAGYKIIQIVGTDAEIEDVCMMKNFKPAANEYIEGTKIFAVKVAEDVPTEEGTIKTIKYALPVFAKNSDEVHMIMRDYIAQGFDNMRLTTISETKWIWVE